MIPENRLLVQHVPDSYSQQAIVLSNEAERT